MLSSDGQKKEDDLNDHDEDRQMLLKHSRKQLDERLFSPRHLGLSFLIVICWLISLVAIFSHSQARIDRAKRLCGQLLYCKCFVYPHPLAQNSKILTDVHVAPAEDIVHYETVLYSQGFKPNVTQYYGPATDERNALWKDLYNLGGGQGIPRSQAIHLVNTTTPLPPTGSDLYYVSLDFLHQLHCLDNLRLALFDPAIYASDTKKAGLLEHDHLFHCIEMLRQGIMCHSDITPIVMQWQPEREMNILRADVPHTCRNFWELREWAKERSVRHVQWGVDNMDRELVVDGYKPKGF